MKDIEKKVMNLLSGMSSDEFSKKKQEILNFLSTPKGQSISRSLGGDSKSVADKISKISSEDLKSKLEKTDLSGLSGKDIDDILKKLR